MQVLLSENISHELQHLLVVFGLFHQNKDRVRELFIVEGLLPVESFNEILAERLTFDVLEHLIHQIHNALGISFPELLVEEAQQILGFLLRKADFLGLILVSLLRDHRKSSVEMRTVLRYVHRRLLASFVHVVNPLETRQVLGFSEVVDEVLCSYGTYTCTAFPSSKAETQNKAHLFPFPLTKASRRCSCG